MHRQWTPDQRKQQSLKIKEWQPWTKSTGPKTLQGKRISSSNAFKGRWRARLCELSRLVKQQLKVAQDLKKRGWL
jgi:hypothetical protein